MSKKLENSGIEISNFNNFIKVDIKKDYDMREYNETKKGKEQVTDLLSISTVWDTLNQVIRKNTIYIYNNDNMIYNIYNDNKKVFIDERIKYIEEEFTDERIIEIEKEEQSYRITRLKHDKIYSTFYTEWYFSKSPDPNDPFYLEDAETIAQETIKRLSQVENINSIIDIEYLYSCIFDKSVTSERKK